MAMIGHPSVLPKLNSFIVLKKGHCAFQAISVEYFVIPSIIIFWVGLFSFREQYSFYVVLFTYTFCSHLKFGTPNNHLIWLGLVFYPSSLLLKGVGHREDVISPAKVKVTFGALFC